MLDLAGLAGGGADRRARRRVRRARAQPVHGRRARAPGPATRDGARGAARRPARRRAPRTASTASRCTCRSPSPTSPTSTPPLHHATNLGRHPPARRRAAAAQLAPAARRLPRPRGHGRRERHRRRAARAGSTSAEDGEPAFGPSRRLDIELELGLRDRRRRARTASAWRSSEALEHVFGVVLLNDWSARDLQAWEYRPLGPFLGKSFATSISAWVTPLDALRRTGAARRRSPRRSRTWRRRRGRSTSRSTVELDGERIAATNARELYWSPAQMIAHLTANGASLRTGDLLGSGTISGPGERRARLADRARLERRDAPLPRRRRRGRAARRGPGRGPRAHPPRALTREGSTAAT